jgi:DNA replication protein DnaC
MAALKEIVSSAKASAPWALATGAPKGLALVGRLIAVLVAPLLLILDDIGLKAYTLEESRDILEIVESRYNKVSTILSGQIAHAQWYALFPDPTIADAIMDRVIHNAYILALDSKKSMREVMAEKMIKTA